MDRLQKLHAFCTKGPGYPSRLEIQKKIERLLAEPVQEFTLYPVGFASQEKFNKAVTEIWNEGYRADVLLSIGVREP